MRPGHLRRIRPSGDREVRALLSPPSDQAWYGEPCEVIELALPLLRLSCPGVSEQVGTSTPVFSIEIAPPVSTPLLAEADQVNVTYVEQLNPFTGGKLLKIERGSETRIVAQQSHDLEVSPLRVSDDYNPHAPFTIRESAMHCGGGRKTKIVVRDPIRDGAKVGERSHVPVEEAHLILSRV